MLYHAVFASAFLLVTGIQATFNDGVYAWTPTKRQTPQGMVTIHTVQVGDAEGNLKFWPEVLQADPGSLVQFQFHPKNHSVVQSSFDSPCNPLNSANATGIRSGFVPVAEDALEMPVWTVMVNDTKPIWLYCGQQPHCQKGMVMVINPPPTGERTLEAYRALAADGSADTAARPLPSGSGYPIGSWPTGSPTIGVTDAPIPTANSPTPPISNIATDIIPTGVDDAATPTESAPLEISENAAPREMVHVATLSALMIAALAVFAL
ncbi:hypothetical protein AJ80_09575 [Polytolypa hystricis UAMH7299]|uniref:Phytocyanin domain-containing protein n=1 Tax=Polytolypa hystricis (strain UAMH7299) TaxID=1447883 RepID=A0A2B7WNY1_POLH7|nr:hypothetical protein AJ80_09575 [Polytolypa hystricis UAMH7299]